MLRAPASIFECMATIERDSGLQLFRQTAKPEASAPSLSAAAKTPAIWLNGDVLGCQCPECKSPVSIRAWLMLGDCMHCGTSFELTEEQEREARRLLAARGGEAAKPQAVATPVLPPRVDRKTEVKNLKPGIGNLKALANPPPLPARIAAPAPRSLVVVEKAFGWRDFLRDLPAWLMSVIVHMVLIILLALWVPEGTTAETKIVLSAVMGHRHQEGERGKQDPVVDEVEIADPGEPEPPKPAPPPTPSENAKAAAELDAADLQAKPEELQASPNLSRVLSALETPSSERMFEGRDPRVRAQVVNSEGGTTFTEAAVARGLRWIAKHQHDNGSWSLHNFHTAKDCNGQCNGQGHDADTAATALAILPMLGAGQTHLQGRYTKEVAGGLKYLMTRQGPDGDLRGTGVGRMYAHGQATIVLCEAFALSGDEQLRDAAQKAVNFIVKAQHSEGGWRYSPGEAGDTSVVGWQLMALRSAKMALLEVPDEVFERAGQFLNRVQADPIGGIYSYQPGGGPTATMTAEALLCRQYLGWPQDHAGMRAGSRFLVRNWLPRADQPNIYYWYYATQVMHHLGGRRWETWNEAMRNTLVTMQETAGHMTGSWSPVGGAIGNADTQAGGRLYMTSLATCTLEVYYRHLPIYRRIQVNDAMPKSTKPK